MREINIITQIMARFSKFTPYRVHKYLYKVSGGKIGAAMPGGKLQVLLLTTTGCKSGLQRTHPVMYHQDGKEFVVSPTNSGSDKPSLWYLNLKANPAATIQIKHKVQQVIAREADTAERARLWPILIELQPIFAAYQKFTHRQIPVMILSVVHENKE